MRRRGILAVKMVAVVVAAQACAYHAERQVHPTVQSVQTIDKRPAFLKAHMRDGDLYVLDAWTIHELDQYLEGDGQLLGADRAVVKTGHFRIGFADVALYETNTVVNSASIGAVALITGISLAVTAACVINPKACFGSCPTFYAVGDDGQWTLQAEGFSDAIAPSLESHDVDALWRTTGRGGPLSIRMTNEAYETHVVKQADVLVVPRPEGGRVLATDTGFWIASELSEPRACQAAEGDCLARVRAVDTSERTSLTDEHDLATRETIDLEFAPGTGSFGLLIGARQSLVTTFLMYQGLAYLGDTVATWLAAIESSEMSRAGGRAFQHAIGGIEVEVWKDGEWQVAGEVYETGPLATDLHLITLPDGTDPSRLRLRLPRGGWRIDYVALAKLAGPASPIRVAPSKIRGTLGREFAAGRTPATKLPIVTLPGDSYDLSYDLPPGKGYELFLDSRGYYLEWMRTEWLHDRNPVAALHMLVDPGWALRALAPAFKRIEPQAEALFWSSRYAHP